MWRKITTDEKDRIINKFKSEGNKFNVMFLLFGIVTIALSITLIEMYHVIILLALIVFILKINAFFFVLLCTIASIPFGLFWTALPMSTLGVYTIAMGTKAKEYDAKLNFLKNNDDILICKTQILEKRVVHSSKSGRTIFGIKVRLLIDDKLQDVEIKTGYVLNETEPIYVLAYKPEIKYMQIFKVSDIEVN